VIKRTIILLLCAMAGAGLVLRGEELDSPVLLMGLAIGAITGGLILVGEYALQKASFGIIIGGTVGLAVGLMLTGLIEWVGSVIFDVETFLFHIGGLVFLLGLPYLGVVLGARFGKDQIPRTDTHARHAAEAGHTKIPDIK